jgi:hypothetical protein
MSVLSLFPARYDISVNGMYVELIQQVRLPPQKNPRTLFPED